MNLKGLRRIHYIMQNIFVIFISVLNPIMKVVLLSLFFGIRRLRRLSIMSRGNLHVWILMIARLLECSILSLIRFFPLRKKASLSSPPNWPTKSTRLTLGSTIPSTTGPTPTFNTYNRVYKCGFATTQQAYENNVFPLFKSLDRLEEMLTKSSGKYLLGTELTEADIRLYVTIVRFDPVYVQHFKTNIGTIRHKYPS